MVSKDNYEFELPLKLVPLLRAFLKQKGMDYEGPKSLGYNRFSFFIHGQPNLEKVINFLRTLDGPPEPNQEYLIIIYEGESEFARISLKHKM